jgi:cell division protein FtsB
MRARSAADQAAVRYLLGELTESQRAELEDRLLESEEAFERVSIAEDELIDEYLRGELSGGGRERFEKDYLADPEHREKLEFARTLRERLASPLPIQKWQTSVRRSSSSPVRSPRIALDLALAAAALFLLTAGSFLGFQYLRSRRQLDRAAVRTEALERQERAMRQEIADLKARNDRLAQQIELTRSRLSATPSPPLQPETLVASFVLTASLVRDIRETQTLGLPRGVKEVRLTLQIREGPDGPYRAILRTVDGAKIWSAGSLKARGEASRKSVVVSLPATALASDDYILTLSRVSAGGEMQDVADYYVRVKKS